MSAKVTKVVGATWTTVVDDGVEVFRASTPGFNRTTRRECVRWMNNRKYTLSFYENSARKAAELDQWIQDQRYG